MKKIIMWVLLSILLFTNVNADIIMPWQKRPCYNDFCIEWCMHATWDWSAVCKQSCLCGSEQYSGLIEMIKYYLEILIYFLPFIILPFILNKKYFKKTKNKKIRTIYIILSSIILWLIISTILIYINILYESDNALKETINILITNYWLELILTIFLFFILIYIRKSKNGK